MSPALAGRLSTTAPPRKPLFLFYAAVEECQGQSARLNCTYVGTGPSTHSTTALFVSQEWFPYCSPLQVSEVIKSDVESTTHLRMLQGMVSFLFDVLIVLLNSLSFL